ncbi:hypothetical protein [Hippea sp. KM1]|uniref:hypothetical protein n=1 Tax=Hippea sp. KM1 TaxID=944481 RepID=UPI00046D3276|nr:hypothetical protein [Hippea sp. KM1]
MRWLKFVYEQYLKDLEFRQKNIDTEINKNNIQHLKKAQALIEGKSKESEEAMVGDVYQFESLYFVISDTEECPYEVFIASPYWELASDKDLIVDGKEHRWVIESLIRYVEEDVLDRSIKIDQVSEDDVRIMQRFINEGDRLPKERTGLSYIKGSGSYQELFKENERKRSLFLMPDLGYEPEIAEEATVNLSQYIEGLEKTLNQRLAAASFDALIVSEYGDITKENDNFVIYFNEKYAGTLSRVYAKDAVVFEGFLPKKLILKSTLEHPQTLLEILKIEPL